MTVPGRARAFLGNRLRQLRHGSLDKGEEIHRQPPGRALLGAARRHHRPDQRWQHRSGVLPADQVEAFQGLVDEVQHVAAVGVDPLGAGHEQQLGQSRRRGTTGDRGEQGALGTVAMANGRPAPQPALQGRRVDGALERGPIAPRRPALQSAATRRAPWNRARQVSSSGSPGTRFPRAVRMVRPTPQASRLCAPNSAAWRSTDEAGSALANRPRTAFATTRSRSWANPSASRRHQWPTGSALSETGLTQTSPRGPRPDRLARRRPTGRTCSRWRDQTGRDANGRSGCRPRPSRGRAGSPYAGSGCRRRGSGLVHRPRGPADGLPAAPCGPWTAVPQACRRERTRGRPHPSLPIHGGTGSLVAKHPAGESLVGRRRRLIKAEPSDA